MDECIDRSIDRRQRLSVGVTAQHRFRLVQLALGGAGIALDRVNPNYTGSLPPYGASNYCVNASVQYYTSLLMPIGNNIRLTQHTWDPQLNAPHPGNATGLETFIGDYFGNATGGSTNWFSFVSTYDDGTNPAHRQQQVVGSLVIP